MAYHKTTDKQMNHPRGITRQVPLLLVLVLLTILVMGLERNSFKTINYFIPEGESTMKAQLASSQSPLAILSSVCDGKLVSINILPNYFEYCDPQITKTD
jgi:hypothetical protein